MRETKSAVDMEPLLKQSFNFTLARFSTFWLVKKDNIIYSAFLHSSEIKFKLPFLVQKNTEKKIFAQDKMHFTLSKLIYTYRKRTTNIYLAFELC